MGEQPVKRIRTEEGTMVPASYKSGRYEKWQTQQKMKYRNDDDEDGEDNERENRARRHKKVWHNKGKSERGPRDEVKKPEQILKTRRKKEKLQDYQDHRRKENLKRKLGGMQNKSKGGRFGKSGAKSGGKPGFNRSRGKK